MKQRNCKNCGSPLEHSYNHRCPYCGTLYDFNEPEENIVKCKPEDLIEVQLRDVELMPMTDSIILMFSGYKCEMPKVYEVDENIYTSRIERYINPPKCGFCIELPRTELEKYGMSYVIERIYNTGIRYNELTNVRNQILNNEKLRFFCRYY